MCCVCCVCVCLSLRVRDMSLSPRPCLISREGHQHPRQPMPANARPCAALDRHPAQTPGPPSAIYPLAGQPSRTSRPRSVQPESVCMATPFLPISTVSLFFFDFLSLCLSVQPIDASNSYYVLRGDSRSPPPHPSTSSSPRKAKRRTAAYQLHYLTINYKCPCSSPRVAQADASDLTNSQSHLGCYRI